MNSGNKQEEKKDSPVDLELSGLVKGGIDVSKYIGNKSKIASVNTFKSKQFTNPDGSPSYYMKVEGEPVETIDAGNGEKIEVKASRLFGITQDSEDPKKFGWTENSKIFHFLKKMGVATPKELIGKEVILQTSTSKDGVDYLSF